MCYTNFIVLREQSREIEPTQSAQQFATSIRFLMSDAARSGPQHISLHVPDLSIFHSGSLSVLFFVRSSMRRGVATVSGYDLSSTLPLR